MTQHLKAFLAYLRLNRNASAHTVRAYESDLTQWLDHVAAEAGRKARDLPPAPLDRAGLRRFLGVGHPQGGTPATPARKLPPARAVPRYLRPGSVIGEDRGALAARPRPHLRRPAA